MSFDAVRDLWKDLEEAAIASGAIPSRARAIIAGAKVQIDAAIARGRDARRFDASEWGDRLQKVSPETPHDRVDSVYVIVDGDGMIAYIGKTEGRPVQRRLKEHGAMVSDPTHYFIVADAERYYPAQTLETALIRLFRPYLNTSKVGAPGSRDVERAALYGIGVAT